MRMKIAGATFLIVGAGAASVGALDNVALQGSDTLEHFTNSVLAACPNATAAGITYRGGGSTTGENAITATSPIQTVTSMSRFLNPTNGVCAKGGTAEGLVIALDGLSVLGKQTTTDTCNGALSFNNTKTFDVTDGSGVDVVNCAGCNAGTNDYAFTDWRDVITMVYAGKGHAVAPIKAVITTGGALGTMQFTWQLNPASGGAISPPVPSAAGTPTGAAAMFSFVVPGTSIVLDFGAGTYVAGHEYFINANGGISRCAGPIVFPPSGGTCAAGTTGVPNTVANHYDSASSVRRSLVDNFGGLFQAGCGASPTCTQLRHAFRRSDLSGTTDTFLTLLNLPSLPLASAVSGAVRRPISFCNAIGAGNIFGGDSDYIDRDPIRRTCDNVGEQACSPNGTLGVVTVIEVPAGTPTAPITAAQLYPTVACSGGQFALVPPGAGYTGLCPNGLGTLFGKCFQPFQALTGGARNFNCLAPRSPVQGFQSNAMTGRSYNVAMKVAETGAYVKDNLNRFANGAFFRMHSTAVLTGGGSTCQQNSSTAQLGCVAQAGPCSISFAGREADQIPGAAALAVDNVLPTVPKIECLVNGLNPPCYPIARKLFFNTVNGFEAITGGELELTRCMANSTTAANAANANGFVPIPGGVLCQDFDQSVCSGAPANTDSCANNGALITP